MKSFTFCCFGLALMSSLALADVSELLSKNPVDAPKASDKSSVSKPKRDASFLIGSGYHGPSYKYLPPSLGSSVYDSYGGAHHGLGGSYAAAGVGGGHSSGHHHHSHHAGHGYSGHGLLGHHPSHSSAHSGYAGHSGHSGLSGISHGFAGSSFPAFAQGHTYTTSSSGGHGYATGSPGGGHHHLHSSGHGHGLSSGHGSLGPVYTAGHGILSAGPSFTSSHSSSSGSGGLSHAGHGGHAGHSYITSASLGGSGLGHKVLSSHSNVPSYSLNAGQVGSAAGLATGYQYAKGISGSLPGSLHSAGSSHLAASGGVGSFTNHGFAGNELHHSDHVHNGNQEHHYVVTGTSHDGSSGAQVGSHGSAAVDGYHYETPSSSYLTATSAQQHHVQPSSSYAVPLAAVGASYTSNYHSQGSGDESPNYAAGHKGLGHFSYTANKPNVLHTSFVDSGFKTPNYSQAPFKPSTFLGTKYEGSSFAGEQANNIVGHNPTQQYLAPSGVGADSTGYDYPVPSSGGLVYQTSSDNATPIHEPESTYLPPNSMESSYTDVANNPSANYLPPNGQSYGASH